MQSTLLHRNAPLPESCYPLGHDTFLNMFGDRVSLRKYRSYGSSALYPTPAGRLFSMEAWRLLMATAPKVSAALARGENASFPMDYYVLRVVARGEPAGRRLVHFDLEMRPSFALNSDQFDRMLAHGRKLLFTQPGTLAVMTPPPSQLSAALTQPGPSQPSGGRKRSAAGTSSRSAASKGGGGGKRGKRQETAPPPPPPQEEVIMIGGSSGSLDLELSCVPSSQASQEDLFMQDSQTPSPSLLDSTAPDDWDPYGTTAP